MATFTNKTAKQPLAIGSLGLLIEPGQSVTVTVANMHRAAESPVVQAWVKSGMLEVSPENGDDAEAKRLQAEQEAEELRKLEEAEAAEKAAKAAADKTPEPPAPPKVPTPAPKK